MAGLGCMTNLRPASFTILAGCRLTASAPRMWLGGSTRRARTCSARPTAPSRYCARCCYGPRNGDCPSEAATPGSASSRTRGSLSPGFSTLTSWRNSGARSTITNRARPSGRTSRRSPVRATPTPSRSWPSRTRRATNRCAIAGAPPERTRSSAA